MIWVRSCAVSSLLRLHDLDAARIGAEALGHVADDRHAIPELDDERLEVEHDGAVLGAERTDVVLQDADQLPVRQSDRVHPERLHAWSLEHPVGGSV